jgi:two-component system chemotaxis response regulator CheY
MMVKPAIVMLDDQRDVLAAMRRDLEFLFEKFEPYECETAAEAWDLLEECDAEDRPIALILCDHVMPVKNGIDLLIELNGDERFREIGKILVTGLATHRDTIEAINRARIDRYIEKPWDAARLAATAREVLTGFVLKAGLAPEKYMDILDRATLLDEMHRRG